jgi:hypothetical protein
VTQKSPSQIHLVLPAGTQIVSRVEIKSSTGESLCPRGAVGEIIKAPDNGTHSYRVRFINGVLTETPSGKSALNDLLIRLRMETIQQV